MKYYYAIFKHSKEAVEVEFPDGQKVTMGKGDLVTFPKGLSCQWNIKQAVKKHYNFGD